MWLVRGLGTAVMHGTTAAILAAIAHVWPCANFTMKPAISISDCGGSYPAISAAVAIHTVFNQFPSQPMLAMLVTALVAPLTLMVILRFGTTKAQAVVGVTKRRRIEPCSKSSKRAPSPISPAGAGSTKSVERAGPQTGALIREYVTVLTRLILTEEEVLLQQSEETHRVETDGRALFKRFHELQAGAWVRHHPCA